MNGETNSEKLSELEGRIGILEYQTAWRLENNYAMLEQRLTALESKIAKLEEQNSALTAKIEALERELSIFIMRRT